MSDQPAKPRKPFPWGRVAIVLALIIVMGAGALGFRLVNRCFTWHGQGMELPLDQQPAAVIQNLAGLVSEPVCASKVDVEVWRRLAKAYHRVPEIDDLNRRRALGSWQEAAIIEPNDPEILIGLARAFIDLGQFNYALRPASTAFRVAGGHEEAGRQLVSIYLALEDELAAADILNALYGDVAGSDGVPLWAMLAVETIAAGVNEDAAAEVAGLVDKFSAPASTDSARFAQAVSLAFQFGLASDNQQMSSALRLIPIADAAAGDRLDAIKLYEQLGLINEITTGLASVPTSELTEPAKLRLARALWLQQENQTVLDRFADDLAFQRGDPEGGLIVTLAALAQRQPMRFAAQLRDSEDKFSTWDQRLMDLQQIMASDDAVLAEALLDRVMGLRDLLPRSGVLSILSAAIWERMEEPELVQSNLATARLLMGAPLASLDRIPRPELAFRDDPARTALVECSSDELNVSAEMTEDQQAAAVSGCWDRLMARFPGSMLVVRAAISDTRLALVDPSAGTT